MGKNNTQFAILGWLNRGPCSGYDLKKFTEKHLSFFWNESYGQIYPILHKLESDGLVLVKELKEKGRPPKKLYSITRRGKTILKKWLEMEPEREIYRSDLLLKLFFSENDVIPSLRQHLQTRLEEARLRLRKFDSDLEEIAREKHGKPELPFWTMTIELGISQELAIIDWCTQTLDNLESLGTTVD